MFDYEREKNKLDRDLELGNINKSRYDYSIKELDILNEKMNDLKAQFKSGHIDGLKYNTIEHELIRGYDAAVTNHVQNKKKIRKAFKQVGYFIAAVICFVIAIVIVVIAREQYKHRSLEGIPEPAQTVTTGEKSFDIGYTKVQLTYVAEYSAEGIVIIKDKFESDDAYDEAAPYVIGLAWDYAAANNSKISYSYNNRTFKIKELGNLDRIKVQNTVSLNEIIPADDTVRAAAEKYYLGDHIKITGYLVNVTASNGLGSTTVYTSTTRGDTSDNFTGGPTANEVIYATEIVPMYD